MPFSYPDHDVTDIYDLIAAQRGDTSDRARRNAEKMLEDAHYNIIELFKHPAFSTRDIKITLHRDVARNGREQIFQGAGGENQLIFSFSIPGLAVRKVGALSAYLQEAAREAGVEHIGLHARSMDDRDLVVSYRGIEILEKLAALSPEHLQEIKEGAFRTLTTRPAIDAINLDFLKQSEVRYV